ncbi:Gfo/Idh/MocA family oxidoreductase [Paenibacillus sp. GD4]|uniref:Gfo/Idh/MocA family protein n=1 Tax=Paenibacillus sp. GD4 TaxID=3068890 RepID=UPI0027966600|nr:Gfo/Idh/MocA family oxidoreductase [Paenibacillus sp. GD4]MDQ1911295.1 Gfo/Idh/MocA family oxidoreductase [Paenibacillus sp. GD4]
MPTKFIDYKGELMGPQVIVIGAGQWGKNLVRTFRELDALAAVVESAPHLRVGLSNDYPAVPLFEDYKEAIENTDAKGVVIATPAPTHYEIASYALQAGKDVFVEKPITLSTADAQKLVELAEKLQRILMVGHLLLYQPAIRKIKELIEVGSIGSLKSLHQERMKLGRVRSVENVLWSFGVHDIAVFLYLTGQAPEHMVTSSQAIVQSDVEDDYYLHLTFTNGTVAHLHTSWLWPEMRRRLVVIGDQGMLLYDEEKQTVTLHQKGIHADLSNRDEGSEVVFEGAVQPLRLECQHFLECIDQRIKPLSDGANGLEVIRVLEQASAALSSSAPKGMSVE